MIDICDPQLQNDGSGPDTDSESADVASPPRKTARPSLLLSPQMPRSREVQHRESKLKLFAAQENERLRTTGDERWQPKPSTLGTGSFPVHDDLLEMAPVATTSGGGWYRNAGGQRCAAPPRAKLPERPPPQRAGASSSSVKAGTGFVPLVSGRPELGVMLNGNYIYGRCGPDCDCAKAKQPPRLLGPNETRPNRLFKKEMMLTPDGQGLISWWDAREKEEEWFGDVQVSDCTVEATLAVDHDGYVKLQLTPRVVILRTHFVVLANGYLRPKHVVGSSQQNAWRGMRSGELADGSMRKSSGGGASKPDFYAMAGMYPTIRLVDAANGGAKPDQIWMTLFEQEGWAPLAPDELPFRVGGPTDSQMNARLGMLRAIQSFKEAVDGIAIDLDREGRTQATTYDTSAAVTVGGEEATMLEGSYRNKDKAPASASQNKYFYQQLELAAHNMTGGVVRTWGPDMLTHCEEHSDDVYAVDALAGIRTLLPQAKPKRGFCLAGGFLTPVFYPGAVYQHTGFSDACHIGGIVSGFCDAYVQFFDLTAADLDSATQRFQ